MGITEIERDLKFIRQAMESSSRYTNVPASGYLLTGLLGLAGTWGTFAFLGREKIADTTFITSRDIRILIAIWALVLVTAVGSVAFCSWRKARKYGRSAWNSIVTRMLLSQIPLLVVTGVLTFAMTKEGYFAFIPGMWLGIYGTVLYSFSYFTSIEHKIEGTAFIILGVTVMFIHGASGLALLGVGFGGIHLVAGIWRLFSERKAQRLSTNLQEHPE